jgi:Secretion system C-terminal sorting domain
MLPNPAKNELLIKGAACYQGDWSVYNVAGQRIDHFSTSSDDPAAIYRLDVSTWAAGIYFLHGSTASGKPHIEKLVVAH